MIETFTPTRAGRADRPEAMVELVALQQTICAGLSLLDPDDEAAPAFHAAIGAVTLALAQLVELEEAADATADGPTRAALRALLTALAREKRAAAAPLVDLFG